MEQDISRWCVMLALGENERWALPQNCLAEIATLHSDSDTPPESFTWRGQTLPLLDLYPDDALRWRDVRSGTGMVAVILGLQGEGCDYWGVLLRGHSLGMKSLDDADIVDAPEAETPYGSAAFYLGEELYQVPDLLRMQRELGERDEAAA